ncbi:hypothetical protein DPMN_074587 [Dreissena polymorpha]|uniref:Uncharacterized protein n=1 Tax=Dreissena polymorpha TaxID=45954 RepID=A0A9D3YK50_DREPO|nr:hypothetical protein DPMN_074587 [Dreissena polymorpha]
MDASEDHTCRDLVTNQNSGVSDIYIVSSFMETQTSQTASKKGNKIRSQGRKSSAKKKESAIRDLNLEEEQSSDWGTEHRLSLDIEKLIQLSEEDSKVVLKIFPEMLMLLTEKDLSVEVEFKQDAEVSDFKACTSIEGKRTYCLSVTGKRRDIKKNCNEKENQGSWCKKEKTTKTKM